MAEVRAGDRVVLFTMGAVQVRSRVPGVPGVVVEPDPDWPGFVTVEYARGDGTPRRVKGFRYFPDHAAAPSTDDRYCVPA